MNRQATDWQKIHTHKGFVCRVKDSYGSIIKSQTQLKLGKRLEWTLHKIAK